MFRNLFKRLIQVFWITLELVGCSYVITYLSNFVQPTTTVWEFVERMIFSYGIYQIIVYIILSNCNDIRRDSYLALSTNYKLAELYFETKSIEIKNKIMKNVNYQLDKGTLNDKDVRNEYLNLKRAIEINNVQEVKYKIIIFEHLMEEAVLNWRFSFLLRIMK